MKDNTFLGDCEDIHVNRTLLKNSQYVTKNPDFNPILPFVSIIILFYLTGFFFFNLQIVLSFKVLLI